MTFSIFTSSSALFVPGFLDNLSGGDIMYSCNIHTALNFISRLDPCPLTRKMWNCVDDCNFIFRPFFLHTEIGIDAPSFWKFSIVLMQLIMSLLLFDISLNPSEGYIKLVVCYFWCRTHEAVLRVLFPFLNRLEQQSLLGRLVHPLLSRRSLQEACRRSRFMMIWIWLTRIAFWLKRIWRNPSCQPVRQWV